MKVTVSLKSGKTYVGDAIELIQYYRVPHDAERNANGSYAGDGAWSDENVRDRGKPIPEVYRLYPDQVTPLDCKWIKFWWAINPMLHLEGFENLLDDRWMLCNGTGWPSRYNCLTGKPGTDPDDKNKNPAFHSALINGGATVLGQKVGGIYWLDTLLISSPVPSNPMEWAEKNKHMWYYATTVAPNGNVTYSTFTGRDGNRQRLRIPILTTQKVYIPLRELDKLPVGFFPPEATWKP